jgi:hypothetical protein
MGDGYRKAETEAEAADARVWMMMPGASARSRCGLLNASKSRSV